MTDILEAFKAELIAHMGEIVTVLVGVVLAAGGFAVAWLKRMSLVRAEVVESAVRQAQQQHGDGVVAEQAAIDELRRMSPKLVPKDVGQAVTNAADKQRAVRASQAPPDAPLNPHDPGDE